MKKTWNQRQFAVVTGSSLILMTIVAGVSMGMVYAPVFNLTPDEFAVQYTHLRSSLFIGTLGWILILICDLVASWGLFMYYRHKNETTARIMGLLRLVYSLVLLVAIVQLVRACLPSDTAVDSFELIQSFRAIWQFGLIIFGIHLLFLAPLVSQRYSIKRYIGVALLIAGVGYVLSNTLALFIANYEQIRPSVEAIFILPMILGELGLAIWMLTRGGKDASSMKKRFAYGSC